MHDILQKIGSKLRWEYWQLLYIVFSLSWLLSPSLNHHFSHRVTYISQYEDPGQPWSLLYRMCDILAALLLGLAVVFIARRKKSATPGVRFYRAALVLLAIIALGSLIDDLFPSACHTGTVCLLPSDVSSVIHAGESVITTGSILLLNILWVIKKAPWARVVLGVQIVWTILFLLGQFTYWHQSSLAQFGYQATVTLWIASLTPALAGWRPSSKGKKHLQTIVHVIAAWIFFGGFIAVADSIRNLGEISHRSAAYFGDNTAWLSQHGVATGLVLMYISRHLWRREYRAWQLTSLLLWLETLKYAVVTPDGELVLLYGLTAAVLFSLRGVFDRLTSVEELQERLKKLAFVAISFIAALLLGVIAFRYKHHQDLDGLTVNLTQFSRHFFLFDVVNDLGPPGRRLLGQVLNASGVVLLLAILVSLFRPNKPLLRQVNQAERDELLKMLKLGSNSTEDYFKYWPQPKSYWWNSSRTAVVAYRVVGNVAFALADPLAKNSKLRQEALAEFVTHTRQNGWLACFLMVGNEGQSTYKKAGLKLFRIGASAVVNIEEFATETRRKKWWRWVLNKAGRQGWQYELAEPPHSSRLMHQLRRVSDSWLHRQNHVERGFALGYFDELYLQSCRLHLLRDEHGLIAFTNELPTFNDVKGTTIDLMRFLPEYDHAMPTLLAHTIEQLHQEGVKQEFDLGFVPLASPDGRTEQIIKRLGQVLMREAVSAGGLEQFKNKFAPTWRDNYIAFDGDWIDLINITRQLDTLLEP